MLNGSLEIRTRKMREKIKKFFTWTKDALLLNGSLEIRTRKMREKSRNLIRERSLQDCDHLALADLR